MHSVLDKTPLDLVLQSRTGGLDGRWYGVYAALVSDISDPNGQGRVKVKLPWSPDTKSDQYDVWARVATLMGGNNRGSWFIPDVNDEVLVAFEGGDARRPYVLGGLWNGKDSPPEQISPGGLNNLKVLRSRNGVKLTLDDTNGQENFIAETPSGQKITLRDGPNAIEIADSNNNMITLEPNGITIETANVVHVSASQVEVTASAVSVNAATSTFSGTVQAQTVICNSIVAASYTPGAGNIW